MSAPASAYHGHVRAFSILALILLATSARGQGYGSPLRRTYYVDDPAKSVCSDHGQPCSIVVCEAEQNCMCPLALPNGAKQPLSAEQCRAASLELPHLPSSYFEPPPVVPPNAECQWHSKAAVPLTECRYRCSGTLSIAKLTLPSGMVRCPGEDGAAMRWGQIRGVVTDPARNIARQANPARVPGPAAESAREAARRGRPTDGDHCGSCYCIGAAGSLGQRKSHGDCRRDCRALGAYRYKCGDGKVWDL